MNVNKITNRIEELKTAREKLITEANQQIIALNAVIAELEELLKPEEVTDGSNESREK